MDFVDCVAAHRAQVSAICVVVSSRNGRTLRAPTLPKHVVGWNSRRLVRHDGAGASSTSLVFARRETTGALFQPDRRSTRLATLRFSLGTTMRARASGRPRRFRLSLRTAQYHVGSLSPQPDLSPSADTRIVPKVRRDGRLPPSVLRDNRSGSASRQIVTRQLVGSSRSAPALAFLRLDGVERVKIHLR